MLAIAYLHFRQILVGRKVWLLGIFLLLPVALTLLIRLGGGLPSSPLEQQIIGGIYLFLLYPQAVCVLLALLYGSSVISTELEADTITYLFIRPIPKWQIILSKYSAICMTLVFPVIVSLGFSWSLFGAPGGVRFFVGMLLGTCGWIFAYTAVFVFLGVLIPKRALIIGIIAVIVEFALSFVPAVVNTITITYYLRSLVLQAILSEKPDQLLRSIGDASFVGSFAALAIAIAAALGVACLVVTERVYLVTKGE